MITKFLLTFDNNDKVNTLRIIKMALLDSHTLLHIQQINHRVNCNCFCHVPPVVKYCDVCN